jgi:hypothetical protein
MRAIRWVYGTTATGAVIAGALTFSEPACTSSSNGTRLAFDSGMAAKKDSAPPKVDSGFVDSGVPYNSNFTFTPGNGMPCMNAAGAFPVSTCDPSDETAAMCGDGKGTLNGCMYDPVCGSTSTCEPFTSNPLPGKGVDNFRMRDINITAPAAIVAVQGLVVATAVGIPNSPDGGATCGENGSSLFNWLISVDQAGKSITTGGSPPSPDPFGVGYCFINGKVISNGITATVAPVTIPATFTDTGGFTTDVYTQKLNIPIFLAPVGVVILPIRGASFHDVSVSSDGNCIGGMNPGANISNCEAPFPSQQMGTDSCSRWHTAGALGGYITLDEADQVFVQALNESLCALIVGSPGSQTVHDGGYQTCTATELAGGDYCAPTDAGPGHACTNGNSAWLSADFAASAVKITTAKGAVDYMTKDICNGATIGM